MNRNFAISYVPMHENVLPLHTPLTPGGVKRPFFFFSESSHVACQINGNEAENTMQANTLPFYTPMTPRWGPKVKTFFSEEGHVAYQIIGKEVKNIMQV